MAERMRGLLSRLHPVSKEARQRENVAQQFLNAQRFLTHQSDILNLTPNGLTTVTFLMGAIQSRIESQGRLQKRIKFSGSFVEQALDTYNICEELGRDKNLTDVIARNEGEAVSSILGLILNDLDRKRTLMTGAEKFRYAAFLSSKRKL